MHYTINDIIGPQYGGEQCAAESDGDEKEAGSYGKTGGIGLAPAIAILGASSVACLTLAHRLGKGDDGEISDV